jgi:hypothetical protein
MTMLFISLDSNGNSLNLLELSRISPNKFDFQGKALSLSELRAAGWILYSLCAKKRARRLAAISLDEENE